MDGEVTQVVEMEVKGIYYLIEGSKELIALMARGLSAFSDWKYQKWLDTPGECSWQKIQEASEGAAPVLEFPVEMFEPQVYANGKQGPSVFEEYCREHNLRYCILPDLDPSDDYIPVAVVDKDISIHQEYIKKAMNERIALEEEREEAYEEEIRVAEQKASDPNISKEERIEAEAELEELQAARNENHSLLEESREKMERDNMIPFDEYLKMGEGTKFESDMPQALEDYNRMGGMVREYLPKECMYPIRDAGMIPKSREIYYSQTSKDQKIYTVQRRFDTDELGIVYSTYRIFKHGIKGEAAQFSDRGYTAEEWEKQLPIMLNQAGMQMDVPTTAIHTSERLQKYIRTVEENFNQPTPAKVEAEVDDEEEEIFLDETEEARLSREREAAKRLTDEIIAEEQTRTAYAASFTSTVPVSSDLLMFTDHQTVALELSDGMIDGIELVNIDEAESTIYIEDEKDYKLLDTEGKEKGVIKGDMLRDMIAVGVEQAEGITIEKARGASHGRS